MNRPSRSVTNSLKGRIWLAAIALAVINGLCGLGVFLTLSFLSTDPTVTILATFFLLALVTLVFGWWLAADVLRPIEEVTLLARSLERSPSASLPRTTGAIETDQLLQTLHRSGQQLQNLIALMDDVAAGKVEAASIPLETSDKLSASFQKLVSKVTDSISAKRDLDEIRSAIGALSKAAREVRNGSLDVNIRSEQAHTKEIADALRFLTNRLSNVTQRIYATTSECERTAAEARSSLHSMLEAIDERGSAISLSGSPTPSARWDTLLNDLSSTVQNVSVSYDRHTADGSSSMRISEASTRLRNGVDETSKLVQKLRSRTAMVSQAGRLAQELAKRSNLIALNATIASNGLTTTELLAGEIDSLSKRSDELYRQIVSAGESLNSEIAGIEKELAAVSELAPEIGKVLSSNVQFNHTLCERIAKIGELEELIRAASEEGQLENDRLMGILEKVSDVSLAAAMVRETESSVQRFSGLLDGLRDSVADLKLTPSSPVRISDVAVRNGQEPTSAALNGFDTMTDVVPMPVLPTPGFEAKTGFETITGFETKTGFETLIEMDARVGES